MQIEIWSDITCPWCYLSRPRFEKALAQFPHHDQVKIIWRSYQLDPNAPRDYSGTVYEMLQQHGMSLDQAQASSEHLTQLAALEGLEFNFDIAHPVNSLDAHRLIHLAAHHGLQSEMKERLQKAYFTDGAVISDLNTLVQLAVEVGLDAEAVRQVIEGDSYIMNVHQDMQRGQMLGVRGVPFFIIDEKHKVSGAQSLETFSHLLERAWADNHSALELLGVSNIDM